MHPYVIGILTDSQGRIFLQKPDEATLAPPHYALEPGILPQETLARSLRRDTGLFVMPVRLTGLYFAREALTFCFRCTMRGGDLVIPGGRPPAGFFDSMPLPRGLSAPHRQAVTQALHHAGGAAFLEQEARGLGARLSGLLGGKESSDDAAPWNISLRRGDGGTLEGGIEWAVREPGDGNTSLSPRWEPGLATGESNERVFDMLKGSSRQPVQLLRVEVASTGRSLTLIFSPAAS